MNKLFFNENILLELISFQSFRRQNYIEKKTLQKVTTLNS